MESSRVPAKAAEPGEHGGGGGSWWVSPVVVELLLELAPRLLRGGGRAGDAAVRREVADERAERPDRRGHSAQRRSGSAERPNAEHPDGKQELRRAALWRGTAAADLTVNGRVRVLMDLNRMVSARRSKTCFIY